MSNADFKRNFAKLLERAGNKAEMVIRKTALELQTSMVEMSPVDTGRFKGNWQSGIGGINYDTSAAFDKTGTGTIGRTYTSLQGWKPGQTIFLTNSMPYARVLEYGRKNGKPGSMQATNGMVRITVLNYGHALRNTVAEMK